MITFILADFVQDISGEHTSQQLYILTAPTLRPKPPANRMLPEIQLHTYLLSFLLQKEAKIMHIALNHSGTKGKSHTYIYMYIYINTYIYI